MNKKRYMAGVGMFSLAMLACSESVDSPVSGTAEEPNVLMANNDLPSSSSIVEQSSSSVDTPNSSADAPNSSADVPNSSADVPNSSANEPTISSSSEIPMSSSSSDPSWIYSSAYVPPVLCKVGGFGCAVINEGDLWSGAYWDDESEADVKTSLYAEDKSQFGINAGKWFLDVDSIDGGKSTIQWAVPVGNEKDSASILPVMEECGGLCGTFELNKGALTYNPFVQVGFSVAGYDSNGVALAVDVSNLTGICLMYKASVRGSLVLDVGDSLNQVLKYDLPSVTLAKASSGSSRCYEWSKFKRAGWGPSVDGWEKDVVGETAARHLSKVYIQFQEEDGTKGEFTIFAIGSNLD